MKPARIQLISTRQAAARQQVTPQRIQSLLAQARIPGALKIGGVWLLPFDFLVLAPPLRRHAAAKMLIQSVGP